MIMLDRYDGEMTDKEMAEKFGVSKSKIMPISESTRKKLRNTILEKIDLGKFYKFLLKYDHDLANNYLLSESPSCTSEEYHSQVLAVIFMFFYL